MMQKVQAKRSKKGFTLVELVIVIAILAILAAIAIPVITTTIKSAKLSTMESDATTLNMLVKEAINTSKAEIKATTWNDQDYTQVTISDICAENDIDDSGEFYTRHISGGEYSIAWDDAAKNIGVMGDGYDFSGTPLTGGEAITGLDPEGN